MTVGVLLVTHVGIGEALADAVTAIMPDLPLPMSVLAVEWDCDTGGLARRLTSEVQRLERGAGVLVLTDLFGATPTNIASRLPEDAQVEVVSGLNLSMLLSVMNYPKCDLLALANNALAGGRDGILACHSTQGDKHAA